MAQEDAAVKDEALDEAATSSADVENDESLDESFEAIKDLPLDPSEATDSEADEAQTKEPAADETQTDSPNETEEASAKDEYDQMAGSSQEKWQRVTRERRDALNRIKELEAENARIANGQQLLNEVNPETGEYFTPQEIDQLAWQDRNESVAQRNNEELYSLQIEENQHAINDDIMGAVRDNPIVNPAMQGKGYVPQIGQKFYEVLNNNLIYALPDGQQVTRATLLANDINPDTQATLVGSNVSAQELAQFATKSYTEAKTQGEAVGQANAQRATEKMMANADAPSGASSAGRSSDLDSLFDRIKDIPLT